MASQSALRARVATIRELLAPDTSKQPCIAVYINRKVEGPLLLTAGDDSPAETHPPPGKADKRSDGHVCGDHCVSVSINRTVPAPEGAREDDTAAQEPASNAQARVLPNGQLSVSRAPGEAPGFGVPARDATIEMRRAPPPGCLPEPGFCGGCPHGAASHVSVQSGRPCLWCGFLAAEHWKKRDPSITHCLLGPDRRFAPCRAYAALYGGPGTEDRCDGDEGRCPCRGFRTTALSTRELEAELQARIAEQDRRLAALAQQIEEQRKASEPKPTPQYSHGTPVHVPGINDDGRSAACNYPRRE